MLGGHLTPQARSLAMSASKLFFLVADPAMAEILKELNSTAESLASFYANDKLRRQTYTEIADLVVKTAEKESTVCLALYGHPGVFASFPYDIVRKARALDISVKIFPGVSAEDCLFADAEFDPGQYGCHNFEATDFLIYNRIFDPRSTLILWQIGLVGESDYQANYRNIGLPLLMEHLSQFYPPTHKVMIYEAAQYPVCSPRLEWVELQQLDKVELKRISTLYIPPAGASVPDASALQKLAALNPYWEKLKS